MARSLGSSAGSWLANSGKSPLQVRLKLPTPPMCGILARRSHFESRFARMSWSYLVPSYLTPVTVDRGSRTISRCRKELVIAVELMRPGLATRRVESPLIQLYTRKKMARTAVRVLCFSLEVFSTLVYLGHSRVKIKLWTLDKCPLTWPGS